MSVTPQQIAHDVSELEAMLKSRAWQLMREAMEHDMLAAAKGLASAAVMAEAEMHFRRGAIFAANGFTSLPEVLLNTLKTQLLLASAQADSPQPFPSDATA
jgi:hypothetical protein